MEKANIAFTPITASAGHKFNVWKNQSVTTHTLDIILNISGEGFTLDDIAEFTPDTKENAKDKLP